MRLLIFLCLVLSACAGAPVEQSPPPIAVSYHVVAVDDAADSFGDGSDRPVLPASTAKLMTALAVLDFAPPNATFKTHLCRNGDTLALLGGGDPSFDVEDMLALAMKAQDDLDGVTAFTYAPAGLYGSINSRQPADAAYNPQLAHLMVAEGAYRGHRAEDGSGWTVPDGAPIPAEPGTDWYAHSDPPRQAADLFRFYAQGLGIDLPAPQPGEIECDRLIARQDSPPLSALVGEMLWTSSNPMAEMLGRFTLGVPDAGQWLEFRHPEISGFALTNFSGLDAASRLTPRAMATLLATEAGRVAGDTPFPAMLTPAGWDGGLKHRMQEPPLALAVWAKTGTMQYGVGLAGYLMVPGKGLHAVALYAFDEEKRRVYDAAVLDPSPEMEADAKAWRDRARAAIDATAGQIYERLLAN
ncbi:MAG: D-alanyl-D-alanine carboxypeptidase [Alphaproteobacteria bacterium]